MQKYILLILLLAPVSLFAQSTNQERLSTLHNIKRIAFGSCNNQNDAQPLWQDLIKTNPDLFIWGGDIIYADWERNYNIKASFDKQAIHPDYVTFKSQVPIIGIWDDHDYSGNEGNGRNIQKIENQKLLLDFLEEPLESPRRTREGVYTTYEFGDEGKRIKIILLDNRYFKNLDPEAPILGKVQWDWLENELKNSKADMHLIMAGLSIFSPVLPYSEEWAHHPKEITRMVGLMKTYKPKGVLFLTGDKHFASIFKRYGQLEFMSSGMTHVAPPKTWWYLSRKYPVTYFGLNYGLIDIDWVEKNPLITLSIRDTKGNDIHKRSYLWGIKNWVRK